LRVNPPFDINSEIPTICQAGCLVVRNLFQKHQQGENSDTMKKQSGKAKKRNKRKRKQETRKEAEMRRFNEFLAERGLLPKKKTQEFNGWVTFVQGGSPGLGRKR
jgi:hypothetical protein